MAQQYIPSLGTLWIEAHCEELERDYPGEYVAADGNGLIAHGQSRDIVMKEATKQGRFREVTYFLVPPISPAGIRK